MGHRQIEEEGNSSEIVISVVVPCRNECRDIVTLLDNICAQEGVPGEIEIIIADGMSTDGTRGLINSYISDKPNFSLLNNPRLITPCGLNLAIEISHGRYIARMDVHSEYASDYLAKCLEVSIASGAANVGGAARTRATGYTSKAIAAAYGSPFAVGNASFHFPEFSGEVDTVPYGFWKKSVFEEIGFFDESLVRNQDDEFNFRTLRKGLKIWQSPKIVSWYKPRDSFRKLFKQYYQYGFWKTVVIRKHGTPASWRHLVPVVFVVSLIGSAIGGIFWAPFLWFMLAEVSVYSVFLLVGSINIARSKGWNLFPLIPLAIGTFHLAYGLGFLVGLIGSFLGRNSGPDSLSR